MKNNIRDFLNRFKKSNFTATKVFSVTKYGKEVTRNQVLENWISSIKEGIQYKSQDREYSYVFSIPEDDEEYKEEIIEHFKGLNFGVYEITKETLKNYQGKSDYILITWDNARLN